MVDEYITWFEELFQSTECIDIIGVCRFFDDDGNTDYMIKCGDVLLKSYEKVREILENHNHEFGNRDKSEV